MLLFISNYNIRILTTDFFHPVTIMPNKIFPSTKPFFIIYEIWVTLKSALKEIRNFNYHRELFWSKSIGITTHELKQRME